MLAQHARRTKLRTSEKGASLAEVVDARLAQHGIEAEKISWDAYRREDGGWRIVATWASGKATAQAVWELDKSRQVVIPHDDMARYLCAERPPQILGQDPQPTRGGHGHGHGLPGPSRGEPSRTSAEPRGRDPIRAGRDALLASLDRPLGTPGGRGLDPAAPVHPPRPRPVAGGAAALLGGGPSSPFEDDRDAPKEVPPVPSLAVLRPRRTASAAAGAAGGGGGSGDAAASGTGDKPRKRLPSWDDVLFGSGPAARESS
jgi:hypothetical protein